MWIWRRGHSERLHTSRLCLVCYKSLGQVLSEALGRVGPEGEKALVVD